ncbi:penicillin-binding protein [Ornithinimicrobium sp. Arc0846-15]|nr:penicillin-binding protein [Ornithinimicrobium laminariae]
MKTATAWAKATSLLGAFLAIAVLMGVLGAGLLLPVVGTAGTAATQGVKLFEELPGDLESNPLAQQSRIETASGSLIATPADENRIVVSLEDIAPVMRDAQVAIEDERFYEHGGLDLQALARALVSNATTDDTQGGSTLTQQYVKLSLQEEARATGDAEALAALQARSGIEGYVRKLRELKYSVTLEERLTKDEVLEGYLNLAYYGDRTYGVEAAARHYFGVKAADLNLPQSATLAGIVRAPGITDPANNPEASLARRNVVLQKMFEQGMISEEAYDEAVDSDLNLKLRDSQQSCLNSPYPYFCDYVTKWLLEQDALGATVEERQKRLNTGGLTITTTLDRDMATLINQTTQDFTPIGNPYLLGSAAAMIEPGTGHVLAFGQSSDYSLTPSDDGVEATTVNWSVDKKYGGSDGFAIGSIAKAFALVTALDQGVPVNSTLSVRAPITGDDGRNKTQWFPADFQAACTVGVEGWTPGNAENANFDTRITLRKATALSVNSAFAQLASNVGTCDIQDTMTTLGLLGADGEVYGLEENDFSPAPNLILGSDDASPLTVANAYATIASGGVKCPAIPVTKIVDAQGEEIPLDVPECERVIDADVAAGVAELMQGVTDISGSGWRAALDSGQPVAGKTGTDDLSLQTWFAGYTPQVSTAVWIGSPGTSKYSGTMSNVTIGDRFVEGTLYGSKLAAPMWKVLMTSALEGEPIEQFEQPSTEVQSGATVIVPDVSGMSLSNAKAALAEVGLSGGTTTVASPQPDGTVLYTSPGSGSSARAGEPLTIFIAGDPATAPAAPDEGDDGEDG